MKLSTDRQFPFARIRRESTREKVHAALRAAILGGRLETGRKLAEIPLARQFGVSRAIIREALQQLGHEGLAEINAFRGARVVSLSSAEIEEALAARLLLETGAVRLARKRMTDGDRGRLRAMAAAVEAAGRSIERFAQLDLDLHRAIWELAGNRAIARLLEQVTAPVFAMATVVRSAGPRAARSHARGGHTALVEAICAGNEKEAAAAIRAHLTANWHDLQKRLAAYHKERQ